MWYRRYRFEEAEADLALWAFYMVVYMPALSMVSSSHLARVEGDTAWNGLVFDVNNLAGGAPSACLK